MRSALRMIFFALLLSCAAKALAVPASELRQTYQPIVDRNPFGLKPPPPPPTNNTTNANEKDKPKLEFFLTGITSVGYPVLPKQAYLMTREQNKSTNFYTLSEGVEKDGIKILSIDDTGKKVRIHTDEGEMMLSFQTHGIAAPLAPAPAKPGAPGQPGQPVPGQPGAVPPAPGTVVQPQPINPAVNQAAYNGAANNTGVSRQIPTRRVRAGVDNGMMNVTPGQPLPGATPGGVAPQAEPQMDPAEQYLRMHLNQTAAQQQGLQLPPLPIVQ